MNQTPGATDGTHRSNTKKSTNSQIRSKACALTLDTAASFCLCTDRKKNRHVSLMEGEIISERNVDRERVEKRHTSLYSAVNQVNRC